MQSLYLYLCAPKHWWDRENNDIPFPNWAQLPVDVTENILQRLDSFDILISARKVCSIWWTICKNPLMWRTLSFTEIHMLRYNFSKVSKLCRYAINKYCGGLEEVYINHVTTDRLLKYIAHRVSHLRCLRIKYCHGTLSKDGLNEAVKKLPQLEELDISNCNFLHTASFEVIGQCCPLLRSLNLNGCFNEGYVCDDHAFSIARTMPMLRNLKMMRNNLSNDGLLAILDGCPLLESLDLRGSFHLDLNGSLGDRCSKQIKNLKLPTDFINLLDDPYDDPDVKNMINIWTGFVFHRNDLFFI